MFVRNCETHGVIKVSDENSFLNNDFHLILI